ncbi:MAG: metal ABC transporter substrate-binding protein [Peptococcaceae bacterium]|jgi:D-methionine transport system substrate-binding protein|nr:metal ABC transporter substrate-binding protein [Peptococcaceae bacterium]MBQ2015055.1 metal ABC transporter substrate-binding protein [Peptococcaceae bacterium]MBQ2035707.1 metal ABC transporter substrate-binding protein [Peptococcaceae bacterium]MBQ2120067.1 metal ABC transporter substrate-binding protein [Peptococcaceae bacterium]MBQ2449801.1 metal ABC transporter substrate-binding protein [Peptococcaceae bacterium]
MKLKKVVSIALTAALSVGLLAGCSGADTNTDANEEAKVITVAASPSPHAEILAVAGEVLAAEGYELKVTEFTDYVVPNNVVENDEIIANYFQHQPYLTDFNAENGTHLVSVASIHYEPFGIYSSKHASLDEIAEGAIITVPNDTTNEARALQLLQAEGIIKLADGAGLNATKQDIVENPYNVDIQEIEAAALPPTLDSADFSVINGNYAIPAGLNVAKDALACEDAASEAAQTFANILVVKEGNEESEEVQALVKALTSEEVKTFINEKYEGAVVPIF